LDAALQIYYLASLKVIDLLLLASITLICNCDEPQFMLSLQINILAKTIEI